MNGMQVTFTARVARPSIRTTSDSGVTRTRIKVDIPIRVDSRGETRATWATVTGFDDIGDKLSALREGDTLYVEGSLKLSSYDKNGRPMIGVNVNATFVALVPDATTERPATPSPEISDEPHEPRPDRRERQRRRNQRVAFGDRDIPY